MADATAAPRVRIRLERPEDASAIRAVHEAAFSGPGEGRPPREGRLVDALRAAGRLRISRVAESNGAVIGHIAFSPVSVAAARDGLGLAPVAVAPPFQGRGVGGALVREGLEACRQVNAGFVVLLGAPAYYGRFGFLAASAWGLLDEYGGGAAFQALELRAGAIPRGAGLVRYAPEFAALADVAS